jgi:two-component system NtrC family sensor kinase
MNVGGEGLVTTIKEKCRMCYACVRECPAEAIRILDGQANVIPERCIGCGNCIRVCSQKAKHVASDIEETFAMIASGEPVAAIIAPSFPAEFTDVDGGELGGMIRRLGFTSVHEVAFGADLVAREYTRLLQGESPRFIATTCPAIVSFVRKYHPDLIPSLIPIVSPMIASSRALHREHGPELKVVFIGPCIAKKGEAAHEEIDGEVDAVLTYVELREMFREKQIDGPNGDSAALDPPHGSLGSLFPITRGLLQAADLKEDLLRGDIVSADGHDHFSEAIGDFELGHSGIRLLDILCCQGCIMGVGMSSTEPLFRRRAQVGRRAKQVMTTFDHDTWKRELERFADLDLRRTFEAADQRFAAEPSPVELQAILARMSKLTEADQLNCGACGYHSCVAHATAVHHGLAEVEMCLPYMIEQLKHTVSELEESNESLVSTKEALVKSEKLASMGQLAAGIAHEVNNPLGILLLQANIMLEECESGIAPASEMKGDISLIVDQANRCKRIISGLLNFARQSRVVRQPTDVPKMVAEVLRTIPADDAVGITVVDRLADPVAEIDSDQIVQVLVNLISNAQQAMPEGGEITIGLNGDDDRVTLRVADTGTGIPRDNLDRLFDPFFTTKQVGMGTGLGLAVVHGIVKMHSGAIEVESNDDPATGPTGTAFVIELPRREV